MDALLYLTTVFIWGTTWLAIKLHLGEAAPAISIFYRFLIAAVFMFMICKIKKFPLRFKTKDHAFLFLLGLCMFSIHYILLYQSVNYLVSGLASVIFSMASVFNIINSYFFFKRKPDSNLIIGVALGVIGMIVFFLHEVLDISLQEKTLTGIGLALSGTFLFSLGNMISRRNQNRGIPLVPGVAVAMGYGACIMFVYDAALQLPFVFPTDPVYWWALLYLAIPGSVVAFLCYLTLIARIGPERAGYATVFFPVIALGISVVAENYQLTVLDAVGIVLIVLGNCIVISKRKLIFSSNRA